MIIVKRGYTLTEHEPTTYNYRYQSVPSPISRTNIYPLDAYDPPDVLPKATTDTGSPVYLASRLTAGSFEGHTEIDCYFSWRSTRGRGKRDLFRNWLDPTTGKYELYEIYDDGLQSISTLYSETPILIAFICEQITMSLTNAHQYNYVAESVRVMYQYTDNSGTHIGRRYLHFNNSDYNSILLSQTGRHTQQDYLYTVSGGIVGG